MDLQTFRMAIIVEQSPPFAMLQLTKSAICFAMPLLFCGTHRISPSRTDKYPFNGNSFGSVCLIPTGSRERFLSCHITTLTGHTLAIRLSTRSLFMGMIATVGTRWNTRTIALFQTDATES